MQSDSSSDQWQEIESQIQETEALLAEVKQKFEAAKTTDSDRQNLQIRQQELERKLQTKLNLQQRQELKAQLQIIQSQLEDIDTGISAQLITWSSFKEPFWQIVRFSGLGFLLGILVKGCVS
jgi:hypothetical protein